MNFTEQIKEGIHWLGVNDRHSPYFERMWPLPEGIVYNSYLIVDEDSVLIDTVAEGSDSDYLARIDSILQGRALKYLVINHMEPDHTGTIPAVLERYPDLKIIGNKQTKRILDSYYPGIGSFEEIKDGQEISIGKRTMRFLLTPWVHWPETMMTYLAEDELIFTGDAFGAYGARNGAIFDDEFDYTSTEDEMRRYYSNIIGKYSKFVQRALTKLKDLPINCICSTHGPVWRSHPEWVLDRYNKWSLQEGEPGATIIVASMYGSTVNIGEYIARQLARAGVREIRFHDVTTRPLSYIISDVWKYSGLVLGSVAYNGEMFPLMGQVCQELEHLGVANKHLAIFGSGSWNGGGVRNLLKFAESTKLTPVSDPVEMIGRPNAEVLAQCDVLAHALAEKILS